MSDEAPVHKRRVRYKGRNPRKFEERYKEHDPETYAEDVERIIAKGNTPVGTHRPICVDEILDLLKPQPGEVFLDATLGYGGHAQAILEHLTPGGRLFGVDADPIELPKTEARLRALGYDEETFIGRQMSFTGVRSLIYEAGNGFDGVVADLGVSSMQLDNPARGFTHKAEGPLDLRLNPRRGNPASELLQALTTEGLEAVLTDNADEPFAKQISQAIKAEPEISTTVQLAQIIMTCLKKRRQGLSQKLAKKSVQRTFMALRIEVNEEFKALEHFLKVLPDCLKPGGRVAILTFHSGEDRRVKKAFAQGAKSQIYSEVARRPVRPTDEECRSNPRASCAKLRWAVRASDA